MSGNNAFFSFLICYVAFISFFHNYPFSVNNNLYTSRIQSHVAVFKMLQNTDQNDEQNKNRAPENISIFNNIFDILKSPSNENGVL